MKKFVIIWVVTAALAFLSGTQHGEKKALLWATNQLLDHLGNYGAEFLPIETPAASSHLRQQPPSAPLG